MEHRIAAEPEDVVNAVGFAPTHRFRPAVMAVTAHQDANLGPVPADVRDDMFEDRAYLHPRRGLACAQDHRHRLAARPFVDMDGQKAALVVVSVEQRELLLAMHRIERVVDVEDDRGWCSLPAGTEQ